MKKAQSNVLKSLLILTITLLAPSISHAFISFPDKIDILQERINIQTVLNTVMTPSPSLNTDGVLGKKSIQAIQAFQNSHGLTPDGKVGPLTRSTLESAQTGNTTIYTPPTIIGCTSGSVFDNTTGLLCTSTPTSPLNISRTLKLTIPRMTGEDIKELQIYLNNNRYDTGIPDGVYGRGTQQAIIKFQQSNNLTVDGSLGPKTLSYITKISPNPTGPTTGCLSSTGFNTLTGQPCANTSAVPIIVVAPPTSSGGGGGGTKPNSKAPINDTTLPTVTAFVIPATATSLTIPITTFTATDNIGVTGYLLTESSTKPLAGAAGWTGTAPTTYVFTTQGAKTLYAWTKDLAGNVSNSLNDSVTITLPDTTLPTVTAFVIPATATSLTIPITTFTATDNIGVTGYLLTESSTKPLAGAAGWTGTAPTSYTFGSILGVFKYNFIQNLKYGQTNSEVTELQNYLINNNYLSIDKTTGYFGYKTLEAVKAFQKAKNLISDGIVGPMTRGDLNK